MTAALLNSREVQWHVLAAVAILGFTAGLFAGMSESPVGTTLVGGVFGLLGGGGALALVIQALAPKKDDKVSAGAPAVPALDPSIIKLAAFSVSALCLAAVLGVFAGVEIRDGRWFGIRAARGPDLISIADAPRQTRSEQLKLLLLQTELSNFGVAPRENNAFVRSFLDAEDSDIQGLNEEYLPSLQRKASDVRLALANARDSLSIPMFGSDEDEDDDREAPRRLKPIDELTYGDVAMAYEYLEAARPLIAQLDQDVQDAASPDIAVVLDLIARFREADVERPSTRRASPLVRPGRLRAPPEDRGRHIAP